MNRLFKILPVKWYFSWWNECHSRSYGQREDHTVGRAGWPEGSENDHRNSALERTVDAEGFSTVHGICRAGEVPAGILITYHPWTVSYFKKRYYSRFRPCSERFLERALCACKNYQCKVTDILLTNITMFENGDVWLKDYFAIKQKTKFRDVFSIGRCYFWSAILV